MAKGVHKELDNKAFTYKEDSCVAQLFPTHNTLLIKCSKNIQCSQNSFLYFRARE
jgi:hypothetical protein